MKFKYLSIRLIGLLCLSTSAAMAQDAPAATPTEVLEPVAVNGLKRDSSMLPYRQMNTVLSGLQRYGQGLFRMDFFIEPKEDKPLAEPPKIAIQTADRYLPIAFKADGSFELPVLPEKEAADADLASNIPKGSAGLRGVLNLTTTPEQLDMATVRKLMSTAHKLRNELLPWYARWLFPQIEGVRVCSSQAAWSLDWPNPAQAGQLLSVPLVADPKDRDPNEFAGKNKAPAGQKPPSKLCTVLSGQEAWPDNARLQAPADTRLSIKLSSARQAS
ncbi:DUF2987 domain-containing protein [Paucibacter sp. Y2R2-4]|uniref:DUF2987 domain-containing protein n=1 Tax=Paucibacter sp. Y2R2-4 TaxID=2893553 RepID=UPI0021E36BF9|nr:DUF2987 domain-containing protein [Paucibacter sp. Y2R2-4]MCV2349136.1 DUF2987 domain-containing protein [Paucibacter sp. Y2R2-4]